MGSGLVWMRASGAGESALLGRALLALSLATSLACGPRPALPAPIPTASVGAPALPAPEPPVAYDLVLSGGRVLDPASGRDGAFDVALAGGRIARIAPSIDASRAAVVIDATGLVVTPGLVDIHTHVFTGSATGRVQATYAAGADEIAPRSCTTTVVDAGSAGHRDIAAFVSEVVARSRTRVLAFLNIVGAGMRGGRSEQDLGDMSAERTAAAMRAHPIEVVGVKVAHYAGRGFEPVDRAVEAARLAGGHVMVDFGDRPPDVSLEDLLLRRLRPGDIYTHMYAEPRGRAPLVDEAGKVRPYVLRARERGVVFDLGYGGQSFVFGQAVPAIAQGLLPDTLSTDTHRRSLAGTMGDLVAVMSKLAALGIGLPELVRKATSAPAEVIGRPVLGRLTEGGEADIAVLSSTSGRFVFEDARHVKIEGTSRLRCEVTIRAGEVVFDPERRAAPR